MFYTDYGLPQFLDRKKVCFKLPKYAKVKLSIKFIKNSTLIKNSTEQISDLLSLIFFFNTTFS